jgi:hypothetical protein
MMTRVFTVVAAWMVIAVGVLELVEVGRQAVVTAGVEWIEMAAEEAGRR